MKLVNSNHVKGEHGTGFEKRGNKGPFECGNCKHFTGKSCNQPDMVKMSTLTRLNGNPVVNSDDCCEYVDRVGKLEPHVRVDRVLAVKHA